MSSYLEKIAAAIIELKNRKGSSLNAIKTFLHADSSESRFINSALKKGVKSGALVKIDGLYKIKQTKALAKRRSIMVPGRFDIRCELDKFYEEVNAMQQHQQQQQFGQQQQWQQQHQQHQAPPASTFGFGGGRRKRRSSKLKRRSRRSSKLKRRSRRSSKLKRRNN
jgi:hypothetical protein